MKANGRRRWRKWAKKNGAGRGDFRRFRRHRDSTYAGLFGMRPGPCPRRLFTLRSLVGMSQCARRWYARVDLILLHSTKQATNRTEGRALLLQWATLLKQPEARECYRRLLTDWRIGERLRPCRWCGGPEAFEACRGKRSAQEVVGGHRRGECVFCRTCADAKLTLREPNPDACDGSGVIPARPRVNASKALAVEPARLNP